MKSSGWRWTMACIAMALCDGATAQDREGVEGGDYAEFRAARLTAVIGNNNGLGPHRAWYNGVYSMRAPEESESPYVTVYAGINLENFFDARPVDAVKERTVFFEPRSSPMAFRKISDRVAELHQEATPVYGIESHMRFELKDPHYIDYTCTCIPRRGDLAGGFFGVFWASYIEAPENNAIYFLNAGSTLDAPFWVQFATQQHDLNSSVRREDDTFDPPFEPGAAALWRSVSPLRYALPLYYGRFRDMVLIYLFKPENVLLRFAHSPSGGGVTPGRNQNNPAWDFQMLVPNYAAGTEYRLRMRVVYKPWVSREEVLAEARKYFDES
jgi:hypothetical protein